MPLSQIDKLVMIDGGGNGNGHAGSGVGTLGRYAGELPLIVERMAESFAAVTGIDLKRLAGDKLGATIDADSKERTVIEPEPPSSAPDNGATPTAPTAETQRSETTG
jgi:hypothetical protein